MRELTGHHDVMIIMMRTTVNIPDDVYEIASSIASARRISLGEAIAELVRQRLRPPAPVNRKKGFPTFTVPRDACPITLAQTVAAEDDI